MNGCCSRSGHSEGQREVGTCQQYLVGKIRNEHTNHHAVSVHVRFLWDTYFLPLCLKIRATSVLCLALSPGQ